MKSIFLTCIFLLVATPLLAAEQSSAEQSRIFTCFDTEDNAREDIEISITGNIVTMINYWGDGRRDQATFDPARTKVAPNKEIVFRGFRLWVDDGRPGSGYLYVPKDAKKKNQTQLRLESTHCAVESCGQRVATLSCTLVAPEKPRR
jgi:hypothetical protein